MPSRAAVRAVDVRRDAPEPSAPSDRTEPSDPRPLHDADASEARNRPAPGIRARRRRPRLVVEGVRPAEASDPARSEEDRTELHEDPIQIGKVQAPPLREETLARDRLLEWLSIKIHRRVVLLIAEAGYG
jgi:hypothetical protein